MQIQNRVSGVQSACENYVDEIDTDLTFYQQDQLGKIRQNP